MTHENTYRDDIYLLVVCKKNNHSFWSTTCMVKDLKWNFPCKSYKKPHKNSKKLFFCTNAKVHEMTKNKMLYKCANNLFF
jgi:hypothetical protein